MNFMKCLSIAQPYPQLILLPASDERHKRIENRTRQTRHRGELLIHASKNREWLFAEHGEETDSDYGLRIADMAFGAIVGVVNLVACIEKRHMYDADLPTGLVWIRTHSHCEGPWLWIVENVRKFPEPVPYKGNQIIFDVPVEVVAEQLQKAVAV